MKKTLKKFFPQLVFIVIGVICVIAFLVNNSPDKLVTDTDEIPRITHSGNVFDMTEKDFAVALNERLKKRNMPQISGDFIEEKSWEEDISSDTNKEDNVVLPEGFYTEHKVQLDSAVTLKLISLAELDDGITAIEIEYNSENDEEGSNQLDMAIDCFKEICGLVEPRFNADEFNFRTPYNDHFELDGLFFFSGYFGTQNGSQKIMYVTTAKEYEYCYF